MKSLSNITIFSNISFLDKLIFTKHLAVMLKSGISLAESLTSLKNQIKSPAFSKVLSEVQKDINNGQSLEKALSKHPQAFDAFYVSLISIGEKSGNLEKNLEYLSSQLQKSYEFRKKIQGAMLYPLIILGATVIIGFSLSIFVLPKLTDLFTSLNVELPLTTKILLFISITMKDYGIFIMSALIGAGVGIFFLLQTSSVKPRWHRLLLSLPAIGSLLQNIILASLCRDLGVMLKSGLTITSALEAEFKALDNLVYKEYISDLLKAVGKGKKISEELNDEKYYLIPEIAAKMIGVGENTGKLEDTLLYLGDFFEEEVDDTTKNLANILEPLLLLGIGLVVAFVALAIISPIYQLTGGIKK